jgi:hypothetical protein
MAGKIVYDCMQQNSPFMQGDGLIYAKIISFYPTHKHLMDALLGFGDQEYKKNVDKKIT